MTTNPMQTVLRRQMGIDAFGLDGDDTPMWDSWADEPRDDEVVRLRNAPNPRR
jgi:hypothetical protein